MQLSRPPLNILPDTFWDVFVPIVRCISRRHLRLAIAGLVFIGRALPARREACCGAVGIFGLVYWLSYNVWWNRHGIDFVNGLPLQICDVNGVIAPLVLLTQQRCMRATLYYWAFALSTRPSFNRRCKSGGEPIFYWFWAQHTIILAMRSMISRCCISAAMARPDALYAVSASRRRRAAEFMLGSDYGYLGNWPAQTFRPSSPRSDRGRPAPSSWSALRCRLRHGAIAVAIVSRQMTGRRKPA